MVRPQAAQKEATAAQQEAKRAKNNSAILQSKLRSFFLECQSGLWHGLLVAGLQPPLSVQLGSDPDAGHHSQPEVRLLIVQ